MSEMVEFVDATHATPISRPVATLGYARVCQAPRILGSGIKAVGDLGIRELDRGHSYGEYLVLDGRVAYPGALPMTVESEEDLGCVTVS
jgi:hypothetical protein